MLPLEEVARAAYAAWELKEFDRAAALFATAAGLETDASRTRSRWAAPDKTICYEARQGFCLWEGGRRQEARPFLERAARCDWKAYRLWGDRYDTDRAYTYLLLDLAAAGEREGFLHLWREATERGRELQFPFPWVRPHQRMLIAACIEMQDPDGCRQVLQRLDGGALEDPELALAVRRARRFLDGVEP